VRRYPSTVFQSRPRLLDPDHPPPAREAWLITWIVLSGAFCVSFTITILSVSRPAIARDLGADPSLLVWLISGPTMATALSSASAGKLGDVFGHRRSYLVGIAGATVFALASAAAWNGPSLIAFRVLGALIGASTAPSSMAIINSVFPARDRSRALGYWSLVVAGGPVVGLVAGGPLVELFGWRMIFVLQAPLLAIAGVVAWRRLPETPKRVGTPLDVGGQVTLGVSLLALLLAIDRGRPLGWDSTVVLGLFALSVLTFVAFVRIELRVSHPLVPLRYFRRRSFSLPVAIQFFANFGYMGGFILAPKLLDEVRHLGPGAISLLLIPRPLVFAICGPIAGAMIPRVGTRIYMLIGSICMTLSLGILALVAHAPATAWVVLAIAISGLGQGSAQPAAATSVANSVDPTDLGVAAAALQLVGMVGASVGMNLLDTIQVSRVAAAGAAGSFRDAYLVGACVSAVGILLALGLRRTTTEQPTAVGAPLQPDTLHPDPLRPVSLR